MDGPPIASGALLIGADGRITAIGESAAVPQAPGISAHRFSGVLIPGLINAHTHLELTGLAGQVEEDEFGLWIRGVRELKAAKSPTWFAAAARQGVSDAFAAGITMVFDTGDSGAVLPALVELGGAGIVYQEVFGPHPNQVAASMAGLVDKLASLQPVASARVRLGVSPHAPYTVSGPLYRAVADLATTHRYPIAVHLAESVAETQFVTSHEGSFANGWRARNIPPLREHPGTTPTGLRSPVAWLDAHGVLGPQTLAIHAIQLDPTDLDCLAQRGVAVAHCPLSNHRHHQQAAPVGEMRRRGIRVGVGTDSVVSVGRLDLFAEMRAARSLANLNAEEALALGTVEAARLGGVEKEAGRLAVGAWGDVAAIQVAPTDDPVEAVLGAGLAQVMATYASGRLVYRRAPPA